MESNEEKAKSKCSGNLIITDYLLAEYDQPKFSPYLTKIITLYCREKKYRYAVPQHFVEQAPVLAASLNQPHVIPSLWLDKAEEDIGHTIVNWLYTGLYETLHDPTTQGTAKRQKEYRRSAEVYCVSVFYGMSGLAIQAMQYVRTFDDAVDIHMILGIAKEIFAKYPGRTDSFVGYINHLREKLSSVVQADGGFFKQEDFVKGFGQVPEFDKFMVQQMVGFYSDVIKNLKGENTEGKVVKSQDRRASTTKTRVDPGLWRGTGTRSSTLQPASELKSPKHFTP
ncbi:uncharacterized protein ASPGLDRAFT_31849 [Aspergillus glaucus CBS 516.65]|uniref:BTB domain-containing protein n=1 Tax=Aspergillus glaucus CBS 516.65 TaxID=1160497 RepID=A0A1L9VXV3_ASPGL|nr:hypothetical protein ASPGLDRAFT_31849 [Aspergillus glaucus CBS 516.65]OJJ88736.1 hypothetical protein ASPGLDRAFT_31849 [Aspergillus glaucus CBS 516.65]